jgi:hypothetical protein
VTFSLLCHNWRGAGADGGTGGIPDPGDTSPLDLVLDRQDPDIWIPFDDAGTPATVVDLGTKQYTNAVTTPVTFGRDPIYSGDSDSKSMETGADGNITVRDALDNDHVHFLVMDLAAGDGTFYQSGSLTLAVSEGEITVNGVATGILSTVNYLVVQVFPDEIFVLDPETGEATLTIDADSPTFVDDIIVGGRAGDVFDLYALIPNENADVNEIVDIIGPDTVTPDPDAGIIPEDIDPGPSTLTGDITHRGNAFGNGIFDVTNDGRILYFSGAQAANLYRSEDYGDTWENLNTEGATIDHYGDTTGVIVGNVRYMGSSTWVCSVMDSGSDRRGAWAYSNNDGDTWSTVQSRFYSYAIEPVDTDRAIQVGRTAASDGNGIATLFTGVGSGSPSGTTLDTNGNISNGNSVLIMGSGNWQLIYSSERQMINSSTLADIGVDISGSGKGSTLAFGNASAPGDAFNWDIAGILQEADGSYASGGAPFVDANGDLQPTVGEGTRRRNAMFLGANDHYTVLYSARGTQGDRVYIAQNPTGGLTDWPVSSVDFLNISDRQDDPTVVGAAYMFTRYRSNAARHFSTYLDDSGRTQLIRWEYPRTDFGPTDGDPGGPSVTDGEVLALFNFNDSFVNEARDAVGELSPTGVITSDAKFGSGALSVPYRSSQVWYLPSTHPDWRSGPLDLGLEDWSIEAWVKPLWSNGFCYLCSNQEYVQDANGRWNRWGGFTISLSGVAGRGKASIYFGDSYEAAIAGESLGFRDGNGLLLDASGFTEWNPAAYNHVRICRHQGRIYMFIGGKTPAAVVDSLRGKLASNSGISSAPLYPVVDNESPMRIGSYLIQYDDYTKLARYAPPVQIDGFRFIRGDAVSLYQFNPPTGPYTE